jgi:tight adherence protein B
VAAAGGVVTALLAFAAAVLAAQAVPLLAPPLPRLGRQATALVDSFTRVGREGRDPGATERRRLLTAAAAAAFAAGTLLAGPRSGVVAAAIAPYGIGKLLKTRRERYRAAVEQGAAELAIAISDALAGGHSLRGAIGEAAQGIAGAPGRELRRVQAELELGATTEAALEAMRARVRGPAIDMIVAAALLQRDAGGDLAKLLRDCARAADDATRLEREARAATAQARFTGAMVVMLPLGGALLAELASPGFLKGLATSFLTAWLVGLALLMQVAAAFLIRRLSRVKA